MKLIELAHHQFDDRSRDLYFADGCRVSKNKYDRLSSQSAQTDTFLTRRRGAGHRHYKTIRLP